MTIKFTIIGLGQIGASVGLALREHSEKITLFGHDREPEIAKKAQRLGAVEKIFYNLPASVEDADVVLLSLPFDQIHETLKTISPCLQANAVVLDTSLVKGAIYEWIQELLPPQRYYVGLVPAINPIYLQDVQRGIRSAHADMFIGGLMGIVAPQGTVGEALKLAADLSKLLGADPYFAEMEEMDGLMAALQILPQLTAAALTSVVMGRPGWKDAQRLAGSVFAEATFPIVFESETDPLVESISQNRKNVVGILDEMIGSLEKIRNEISDQDDLKDWLDQIRRQRSKWWQERSTGVWQDFNINKVQIPKSDFKKRWFGDMGKMLGLSKPGKNGDKK